LAYEFTENPSEQASNVILLKRDELGRTYADFESATGKEQLNTFKDSVRDKILTEIDTKREIDTYTEPEPNYSGSSSGSGDKKKINKLGITIYENSNNALRTGNLKNLDPNKGDYFFTAGENGKKNTILIYPKIKNAAGKYVRDTKAKPIRIYSSDQLAQYINGVDKSEEVPTRLYNLGKDDWSKLNEGRTLKGNDYTSEDINADVYGGVDASQY
jgi:hypothetical protein